MKQRPTVFIVGRQKNDKKEPTISKAEIDKRIAKVKTIMRYRDNKEKSKHDLLPIKPPAKQVSTLFNLESDKSHALPFSPSGLSYNYWKA